MSDYAHVILTVLPVHEEQVLGIAGIDEYTPYYSNKDNGELVDLYFEEVNYGELPFLYALMEQGIPYTSSWSSGDEFGEGEQTLRFTPEGVAIVKNLYKTDKYTHINYLEKLCKEYSDNSELGVALRKYVAGQRDTLEILPWKNQVEYGKRYRALQLINPQGST